MHIRFYIDPAGAGVLQEIPLSAWKAFKESKERRLDLHTKFSTKFSICLHGVTRKRIAGEFDEN